jgi:ATP-binding cassette subfamily B protein
VLLALRYYGRQMARLRRFTVPAMLLPALGNTCIFYIAPLIVAHLVGRLAGHALAGIGAAMPYVLGFAAVLLFAEVMWRIGIHCLNRLDGRGIENLYVIGMDELLAKDAAFFHGNFAGSLTKRVLSFASGSRISPTTWCSTSSAVWCRWRSRRWCCGATTRCSSLGSSA